MYRNRKIGKILKKEISIIFSQHLQDYRIKMTTVTDVVVSKDLLEAKVFVSFLYQNSKKEVQKNIKILKNAKNFVKKKLVQKLNIKFLPKLSFFYDNSLLKGIKIFNKIK
ncbi:30S ribosome-binding factor RbfA [bacterium endosymbiont of Pedicinus badii]|uniref:30S ribosome-binding factor RbfA n=1 Tax=bacterium endosymbiont of Pedicinus badii TaxID=1719126 RepID=UPI0009BB975B|nr:30S ribosome-binding factor RbfA [bacterium endosymbiont of Pedicinus badii]OQM34193.1 hypothetical protein AOQ89_02570 [bacterium endosymbiont of Pedicinus badii]